MAEDKHYLSTKSKTVVRVFCMKDSIVNKKVRFAKSEFVSIFVDLVLIKLKLGVDRCFSG